MFAKIGPNPVDVVARGRTGGERVGGPARGRAGRCASLRLGGSVDPLGGSTDATSGEKNFQCKSAMYRAP